MAYGLVVMGALAGSLLSGAQAEGEKPVFTEEQARRGQALYAKACAACHGMSLRGGTAPPLAGPAFASSWSPAVGLAAFRSEPFTLDDLLFVMRTTMPPGAAQSLSAQDHAAILAHILLQNGYSAGSTPLEPDSPRLKGTPLQFRAVAPQAQAPPPPSFIEGRLESAPAGGGPTQTELLAASTSTRDWLYHTHDYSGGRHVALDQINTSNASRLQVACAFQAGEVATFQTGPIVYDGTMFVTTARTTMALDASNCRLKWRHAWEPKAREVWPNNRGVAIKDGRLVRGTSDGYLVSLNAKTGELIWARRAANSDLGETFTMAPLIYEDLVLIGPAGSENAISGWVGAFRLADGAQVWRFKTVPGADEPGSESWKNPQNIKLGGGAVWTPFSFDPESGELYIAVTNPAPDLPAGLRLGDNLYTNSLVALDIRTGKLRWYKQLVPNDSHDWDLTQVSPLFRTTINDHQSSLIATAGKDGMLRTLDRNAREVLYETAVTTRKNVDVPVTSQGVLACPGILGGVEWNGPAFNPGANLLYVPAVDWCTTFWSSDVARYIPGRLYLGGSYQFAETSQGWITAVDASSGAVRWRYRSEGPIVAAVTTTSGNLVFSGELSGDFVALDAQTGETLYRFNTGGSIGGGIVTYQLDGRQYVAVTSGRSSLWLTGPNPGTPTMFLFALPKAEPRPGQ